jgi:gliding motility-associated-like protein
MVKHYFLRGIILLLLLSQFLTKAEAQYAIGGTAGPNLVNSVYWLTWDKSALGSTLISVPSGADANHIINGTYVWQFSPAVKITATLSNESFTGGDKLIAYTPGVYQGDGLDLIYSGNNLPKPASRGVANSALATIDGETVVFDIDIKVSILINGVWTDTDYPGMIIADAESIDAYSEYISGITSNSIAWQLLNKRTTGNANDDHYKLELSNSSRSFKLYADQPPGNFGVQAVMFARGAKSLKNLSMKGSGLTAMAIGFILPFDFGDAPESYGFPGSYIDSFKAAEAFSNDGTYAVVNYNTSQLIPQATVYIGANNVDADGLPIPGTAANNDDVNGNDDESSLTPSLLNGIKVNQAGNIVLSVPVTNTKAIAATLYGWLDFNNDGVFAADELAMVNVPANTSNQSVNLTFQKTAFSEKIKAGALYARLRITTSSLIDDPATTALDEKSTAYSADGEVEDYKLKDITGINIAGSIFDDGNGASDGSIAGKGIQIVDGHQLYVYLTNNANTIVGKTAPDVNGNYLLSGVNNGAYNISVSTDDAAVGNTAPSGANLPQTWVASGEYYGINNTANTGIKLGPPDLKVQVTTPDGGIDVTNINFGIDQIPITNADAAVTNIGQQVIIDVAANDTDADGTLNLTKVMLIDPADQTKKSSINVKEQGTYNVNAADGKVTFIPDANFLGKSRPVSYTIQDDFGAESKPATIIITVKPVGLADSVTTLMNTAVTTTVTSNDGPSGSNSIVVATNGSHGTTVTNAANQVIYTPAKDYYGPDSYNYTLNTADSLSSEPILVTVNVVKASPLFKVTKVANNIGVKAGDVIVYTLLVSNTGNVPLTNLVVTDNGADPGSIMPTTINNLEIGASAVAVAKHTLTQAEVDRGKFSNQAKVSGTDANGNQLSQPSDDPATPAVNDSTVVVIAPAGSISVVKNGIFAGNEINYNFLITNTGNVTLHSISLTDAKLALADTPITVMEGGLLPGASVTYTSVYHVLQSDKDVGSVTNIASVSGKDPTGNTVIGEGRAVTPVPKPPVAVDDAIKTNADESVVADVLKNDDAGNSTFNLLSVEITTKPLHGDAKPNTDGTVTYYPALGYTGTDVFNYRVQDAFGYYTNIAKVCVSIDFTGLFKIPNLFTPNGDGINDVFEIRGLDQFAQNEITIVNRWGNEVYRQTNYKNDWAGDRLNEGTYYYVLHVKRTLKDDWQVFKGYTTLLRTFNR